MKHVTRHFQELLENNVIVPPDPAIAVEKRPLENDKNMLVDDVVPAEPTPQQRFKEERTKRAQQENRREERLTASKTQIEGVNKEAKRLAHEVDTFIKRLREAARQAHDNPRLATRLEQLRRMSVNFIRTLETQLPGYATALFVEPTEE